MNADKPTLGVALMLGFCALAPLGDGVAKLLGGSVPLLQIVLARFAVQAVLLMPLIGGIAMSARAWRLTWLRTALHVAAMASLFTALRYLPLADAIAIVFVMPFVLLLLGRAFLHEQVGWHRLSACAVGFGGTLLVVQPSFAEVGLPALLPLLAALLFALFMLTTRRVAKEVAPVALQAWSGLIATGITAALIGVGLAAGVEGPGMVWPTAFEASLLVGLGLIGTGAHLLMTWSLRFAPSATLAPMQYLEIPVAALVGWAMFKEFPDGLALAGIAITVASGLYVLHRERIAARLVPLQPGP